LCYHVTDYISVYIRVIT